MSKRANRQPKRAEPWRKDRMIIAVIIVVSLFSTWIMLASSGALDSSFGSGSRTTQGQPAQPSSFNSNSPSKEYIYAGGRLVATEEPTPGGQIGPASTIGVFRPSISTYYLRNSNTQGSPDITVSFGDGPGGDIPIVGDWDGNGSWTIGVYRPGTSTFYLRNTNTAGVPDVATPFGAPGDMPVVGDWDGNGTTTIGLYRSSISTFYLRNSNMTGSPDLSISYGDGPNGDKPLVGDWDGL